MTHFAPPAVKAAERILLDVELAVRRWPRAHRYAIGADLRKQALALAVGANLAWRIQIERFLAQQLGLSLKADVRLRPLASGVDFLGYVVRPTHTLVRRRVVSHAREALEAWGRRHVDGQTIHATPEALRAAGAVWGSYRGHLQHADSGRLERDFHRRFPWLQAATIPRTFPPALEDQPLRITYGEAA